MYMEIEWEHERLIPLHDWLFERGCRLLQEWSDDDNPVCCSHWRVYEHQGRVFVLNVQVRSKKSPTWQLFRPLDDNGTIGDSLQKLAEYTDSQR